MCCFFFAFFVYLFLVWSFFLVGFAMVGGGDTLLTACPCGQASSGQTMLPCPCIQFSEKEMKRKKKKPSRSLCRSKHFLLFSSLVSPQCQKLSLPCLFPGSFIRTEMESLFPGSRTQNASVCLLRETIVSALFMRSQ